MSFTFDIINELAENCPEKTCCMKAFLFGLFFGAEKVSEKELRAEFKTEESAGKAVMILKKQFAASPDVKQIVRAGRKIFSVTVSSKALLSYIDKIDKAELSESKSVGELEKIIGFDARCICKSYFLAGVFITSGTATNPQKRYSVEFGVKSDVRAEWLSCFLTDEIGAPSHIERANRKCLYYKKNEKICDVLAYMGANNSLYTVLNTYASNLIKNQENRATNCDMKNIKKTVATARRQIMAIEFIKGNGQFEMLSDEIQYTANLRCKYNSATLSELAELHDPPISRSKLNHRLERIVSLAGLHFDDEK